MKSTLRLFLLLLLALPAFAQEPVITWGPTDEREFLGLQNLHMVGTSGSDFYTVHQAGGQATLERYNVSNQRLWATALLPKTTNGLTANFYDVLHLEGKLYLVSTHQAEGVTTVYAQEITASGNYRPAIRKVISARTNGTLSVAVSEDRNDVLVILTDRPKQAITAALFNASLSPRWTQTFPLKGTLTQATVLSDGTSFVLAESNAAAPPEEAFYLYRLNSRNGKPEETAIGHQLNAPTQVLMAANGPDLLLAGFYSPAAAASAEQPEPVGTFFYRFSGDKTVRNVSTYTPFDAQFIRSFKSDRADFDRSRRLRSLQLKHVKPTAAGGVFVIGEVQYQEQENGRRSYNRDEIIVTRLQGDGTAAYMTGVNKWQNSQNGNSLLYSFLAATRNGDLHLFYQNFGSPDSAPENTNATTATEAVLTKISASGRKETVPIQMKGSTGNPTQLRPAVSYPISEREFIILGSSANGLKYGRLNF